MVGVFQPARFSGANATISGPPKGYATNSTAWDQPYADPTWSGLCTGHLGSADLYVAFGDKYGIPFSRISNAESRHLTEVRIVLKRYAIADPTAGKAAGSFATASTQQLYNKLVAQGTASVDGAYAAARTVEKTEIADLKSATTGVTAPDALQVYKNLLAGSQRHLVAFGG